MAGELTSVNPTIIWSLGGSFVVMVALGIIYKILGAGRLGSLITGADNRASSSKLQWTIWTIVILYAFVAIYITRISNGHWEPIQEIPQNVLIAMGISAATMASAKAITTERVANGSLGKTEKTTTDKFFFDIINDDEGNVDLSKVQMMAWTLIAAVIYLSSTYAIVATKVIAPDQFNNIVALPDIPAALMVLMGLGSGAYIGKKLVTKDTPRITGLNPGCCTIDKEITINGDSFGTEQKGSLILIDEIPVNAIITTWDDKEIKFKLPSKQPNGAVWAIGKPMNLGLVVNGQAANKIPFTIEQGN